MNRDEEYQKFMENTGVVQQCQAATNEGKRCKNKAPYGKYCTGLHADKRYGSGNQLKPGFRHFVGPEGPATDYNFSKTYKHRPALTQEEYEKWREEYEEQRERETRLKKSNSPGSPKKISSPKKSLKRKTPSPKRKTPSPKKKSPVKTVSFRGKNYHITEAELHNYGISPTLWNEIEKLAKGK